MSFKTLATAIARAFESGQEVRFIWHGGEPLLRGIAFFNKALAVQQELARPGQQYRNNLQTNGLLLKKQTVHFLKKHGFHVGVSIDGPALIHDRQRPIAGGKSSHAIIMRGVDCLRRQQVSFGVISVITRHTLKMPPTDFLDFFYTNKLYDICLLPLRGNAMAQGETLDPENYYSYLKALFNSWLERDDPRMHIREFGDLLLISMGWPGSMCGSQDSCVGGTLSVEPDGTVYHCDKFSREPDYCFGRVDQLDFRELPTSETACRLRKRDLVLPLICQKCEWLHQCAGGCSHDRLVEDMHGSSSGRCFRKDLLAHIRHCTKNHPTVRRYIAMAGRGEMHCVLSPC